MQYLSSYSHKNLRHDVMSANIENNRGIFKSQVGKIKHFLLEYQIDISVIEIWINEKSFYANAFSLLT